MSFYRKYRPQSLDELIGQSSVKETLKSVINTQKLSHAYLFCGPRGTGKTSTARILAKMINCTPLVKEGDTPPFTPCNECSSCRSITDGSNMDVIEMDAASNRGIEDIRTLRDGIKLSPTSAKKKVYIIDEAHMLTTEAFNALLKILEEPPSHVVFVLATTDPQKIPATILSRVQRLEFKLASIVELVAAIENVVKQENIKIDADSIQILARKAQGSFRDCIKYLDQLSGFEKIDSLLISQNLGTSQFETVAKLLTLISEKNYKEALGSLIEILDSGVNIKEFNLNLLDSLRQILLIKNNLGEQIIKKEVQDEDYKILIKLAEKFTLVDLIKAINCFQESIEQSKFVTIPSLPLEVAVIGACGVLEEIVQVVALNSEQEARKETVKVVEHVSDVKSAKEEDAALPPVILVTSKDSDLTKSPDIQKIYERWSYVLEIVRQSNFSLEALLRSSKIIGCDDITVNLEVPYSFHQRILEAPKSRDLIESIFSDILGRNIRISITLGQRPERRDELSNVEVAADDEIIRLAAEIFSSDSIN